MANAYSLCLRSGVQSFSAIEAGQLQLFTLRGLMYCRELTKWCYIRYLPVKKAIWNSLNQFYRFAEQQQTLLHPLSPYAGHPATSPLAEYLHSLLLALATPEKLLPVQIDLISEWLKGGCSHLSLEHTLHLRQQSYAVNLNLGAPPRRLQRDLVGEGWRYLNTGPLVKLLQENAEQLLSGTPPASLGLPDSSQLPFNIELMQRLALLWSNTSPPPARRDKRTPANRSIMVIQGVSAIAHHLWELKQPAAESKKFPPAQHLTLENESASGLGVQLSARQAEKLQIGEIVGIVDERQPQALLIGIIRRLACRAKGEIYAGIEILSQNPVAVEITPPAHRAASAPSSPRTARAPPRTAFCCSVILRPANSMTSIWPFRGNLSWSAWPRPANMPRAPNGGHFSYSASWNKAEIGPPLSHAIIGQYQNLPIR